MKAIVAVDENWAIGCDGNLLQRIPADMAHFRRLTLGKVIVMGRKTLDSLPGRKPLLGRQNIVLSGNKALECEGLSLCCSLQELVPALEGVKSSDIFVIGGEAVYRQLLPYCTEAYVTRIKCGHKADKYFINLDEDDSWELVERGETQKFGDIEFYFSTYINKNPLEFPCKE